MTDDLVRYPRCWLAVGGERIPMESATVTRKSKRHCDTFSGDISLTAAAELGISLAQWADWKTDQDVSVLFSVDPGAEPVEMVSGRLDRPRIKLADMTVSIEGRDKSASLTEKKRNQKFLNRKSSETVAEIARDHKLEPACVETDDFAGKLYTDDTAHLVLNRTDYETVSALADREGYRWYVEGSTLYFEPKTSDGDIYPIYWYPPGPDRPTALSNCLDLELNKNGTCSRPHRVTYAGWHHGKKKLFKHTAEAGGEGDAIEYRFHHNGNTLAQLTKKAKSRLKDLLRHELSIVATLPADLSLNPRMRVQLRGTTTIFDQVFDIDEIEFHMAWEDDFIMKVDAKAMRQGRQADG